MRQPFLRRLRKALHYLRNPGGRTRRHDSIRRTKAETTAMLRREVAERQITTAVLEQQLLRGVAKELGV